ncbi:hypothetical protein [Marmoricola sp. RAF53]|uniref:hypothetical protein n=1 Tax=Marmoricola sp. RAF53 TaxID=3233059 RepID=UPI003F9D49F2
MTAFDRVLVALDQAGARTWGSGGKIRAQCPGHQELGQRTQLSLMVDRKDDRAGLHCFAGCRAEDVLAALGLRLADLYDQPLDPSVPYVPRREPSPWDQLGDIEHFCDRILQHQADCATCAAGGHCDPRPASPNETEIRAEVSRRLAGDAR